MLRHFILVFTLAFATVGMAQTLSLRQAVEQAIEQSLDVSDADINSSLQKTILQQAEMARYPNVSFRTNGGLQFGLNVDPTTNDLVQQRIGFTSHSLDAGVPLYQGGRIKASIAQGKTAVAAAEASADAVRQTVALNMAQTYLQVLLAKEELQNAESARLATQALVTQIQGRINAGSLAPVELYTPQSDDQRAAVTVVNARNALQLAELNLKQLLRLDPAEALTLVNPETIDFDAINLPAATNLEVYQSALSRQPSIRAATLNEEAAKLDVDVARSNYYPTLSAFGRLDTRYSDQAIRVANIGDPIIDEQNVFVNGQPVTFGVPRPNPTFEPIPFTDQIRDFFGQSVGLTLAVPILNNGITNAAVQRAKLQVQATEIASERERLRLEVEVAQALQAAQAAQATVTASQLALTASQAAYDAASRRAELGAGSTFEVSNLQLRLEQAQIDLLRARYQFLFNVKVVDFYLGRPLSLD